MIRDSEPSTTDPYDLSGPEISMSGPESQLPMASISESSPGGMQDQVPGFAGLRVPNAEIILPVPHLEGDASSSNISGYVEVQDVWDASGGESALINSAIPLPTTALKTSRFAELNTQQSILASTLHRAPTVPLGQMNHASTTPLNTASFPINFAAPPPSDEDQLRMARQGVSIEALARTLDETYPDATDAQKVRRLLQLIADSMYQSLLLRQQLDAALAQTTTGSTNESFEYQVERSKLFETRAYEAEKRLAEAHQEVIDLRARCDASERETQELKYALQNRGVDDEAMRQHVEILQIELTTASSECERLKNYCNDLEDELATLKAEHLKLQSEHRQSLHLTTTGEAIGLHEQVVSLEALVNELREQLSDQNIELISGQLQRLEALSTRALMTTVSGTGSRPSTATRVQMEDVEPTFEASSFSATSADVPGDGTVSADVPPANGATIEHLTEEVHTLENLVVRLKEENKKLRHDKAKLKNGFKQLKELRHEFGFHTTSEKVPDDASQISSDRDSVSSIGAYVGDAITHTVELLNAQRGNMSPEGIITGIVGSPSDPPRPMEYLRREVERLQEESADQVIQIAELQRELKETKKQLAQAQTDKARALERSYASGASVVRTAPLADSVATAVQVETNSGSKPAVRDAEVDAPIVRVRAISVSTTHLPEVTQPSAKYSDSEIEKLESTLRKKVKQISDLERRLRDAEEELRKLHSSPTSNTSVTEPLFAQIATLSASLKESQERERAHAALLATLHLQNSTNADRLRELEQRSSIEVARREETIHSLRSNNARITEDNAYLKQEIFVRDEEIRRLTARTLSLETTLTHGALERSSPIDPSIVPEAVVAATARSNSRYMRSRVRD